MKPMLFALLLLAWRSESLTLSSRLIHRFSDEAREIWRARSDQNVSSWISRGSAEYYRLLAGRDRWRRSNKLGVRYQVVFPSQGSETVDLGNDFGWLHYTWIDIGTPNVSFLVALDAGSDLFWVPCNCIQCASLSGDMNHLDKDLSVYSPTTSSTSKHLPCSHELCSLVSSGCDSPKQPCPYLVNYYSENTSSSGLLMQDTLYLASSDGNALLRASVIIGCGSRQSGGYLSGIAPDGLIGLGLGNISVPSVLAREGLVRDSFSLCFQEDDSGRILFGDVGISSQRSTPFVSIQERYPTYIIEVERWCIGSQCLSQTGTKAIVDSGSSFTYLPAPVFDVVVAEFDKQMNRTSTTYQGSPFQYCYKASSLDMPTVPKVTLMLAVNQSFVINTPLFLFNRKQGERQDFCLALQPSEDPFVTIGQNIMTGYRLVFDREDMKLAWSPSSQCEDPSSSRHLPLNPPPIGLAAGNSFPTAEMRGPPGSAADNPALAGRAPITSAAAVLPPVLSFFSLAFLLLLLAFSVVIFAG